MTEAEQFAAAINRDLGNLKVGTLRFWGSWFGRPYDNRHQIVAAGASGNQLEIRFNEQEVLTVWSPLKAVLSKAVFQITDAKRVQWKWYCYGRPQIPKNLYFEDYVRGQNGVTNADWYVPDLRTDLSFPAVELL